MSKAKEALRRLEWSGKRSGPGSMMGRQDGNVYNACPACHGLQSPNADFTAEAVGHRSDCYLMEAINE